MAETDAKFPFGPRRARDKAAVDEIRVPPHSIEAEQAVLGGLMLDNRGFDTIGDRVTAEDFYRRDHQLIFEAISELAARSEPFDAVTLSEALERKALSEQTGGLAQREAQEQVGGLGGGSARIAQRARQVGAEHVADADAGADQGDTGNARTDHFCSCNFHCNSLLVFSD